MKWIKINNLRFNLERVLDYVVFDDRIVFVVDYLCDEYGDKVHFFNIDLSREEIEKLVVVLDDYFEVTSLID